MKRKFVFWAFASAFLLSIMPRNFIASAAGETVKGVNGDLELQMTVKNTTIVIGEQVNITLTLKNIGGSTIWIWFGSPQSFDLYLYDENNELVCRWSDGFLFLDWIWDIYLEPNETYTDVLDWNFYKYADPGSIPPKSGNYSLVGECVGHYDMGWYMEWWPAVATSQLPITLIRDPAAPTADFAYSPSEPVVNRTVTFNASSSLPGWNGTHNTPIVSYAWNFSDHTPIVTEADPIIDHIYTAEGIYAVTLNVTDSQGLWNTISKTLFVIQPWISEVNVTPSAPNVVDEVDVWVSFESSMYPGVEEWGNLTQVGNTFSVNVSILKEGWVWCILMWEHTCHLGYLPAGLYQFEVYVNYSSEGYQDYWLERNVSFTVTSLEPTGPTASFTYSPPKPLVNGTVTFDASASKPGWNDTHVMPIVNYTWNFGDGNITTTSDPIVTHEYKANDTYTATLNVTDSQGLWNTTSKMITIRQPVRDIAVTNVVPLLKTIYCNEIPIPGGPPGVYHIYSPWLIHVKVTVKNEGEFSENFDVVTYCDDNPIGTQTITELAPGANVTLTFPYHFPDTPYITYTLSANATVVPGETDTEDNIYVDGTVKVERMGDASWDKLCDVTDFSMLGRCWYTKCGDPEYNPMVDFNGDGGIDVTDFTVLAMNWYLV